MRDVRNTYSVMATQSFVAVKNLGFLLLSGRFFIALSQVNYCKINWVGLIK